MEERYTYDVMTYIRSYNVDLMDLQNPKKMQVQLALGGIFYDLKYIPTLCLYIKRHQDINPSDSVALATNRIKSDIQRYMTNLGYSERNWSSHVNQRILATGIQSSLIKKLYNDYIVSGDDSYHGLKYLILDEFHNKSIFREMYIRGGSREIFSNSTNGLLNQAILQYIDYKVLHENGNQVIDDFIYELEEKNAIRLFPYENMDEVKVILEREMV